jgi:hypothetical protein
LSVRSNAPRTIDADVHNAIASPKDLLPFLPKDWHSQWLSVGPDYSGGWYSPIGVMRKDATPEGGGSPGSAPYYLKKHHLDNYGIDHAILTGSGVASP